MPKVFDIENFEYNEAANLINLPIINNNHKLLDNTIYDIEDSILLCENPEIQLVPIRNNIFYIRPEFLENPTEAKFINIKNEIDAYINNYNTLCNQLNDFLNDISISLKKIEKPVNGLRIEVERIRNQFEYNIKNLCIPFISGQEGLDKIDISKLSESQKALFEKEKLIITRKIDRFKTESEYLNEHYKESFRILNNSVKIICDNIKNIPLLIVDFQNNVEEGMEKSEEILENFDSKENYDNFHVYFEKLKDSLKIIQNEKELKEYEMKKMIDNLEKQYKNREYNFESLKIEISKNIEDLKDESNSIENDIRELRNKLNQIELEFPKIDFTDIIVNKIFETLDSSVEIIKAEENSIQKGIMKIEIDQIIKITSLDLLFLMDTTGSMEEFFISAKNNLINIIDKIRNEQKEIEINLGFIGYKDIKEISKDECKPITFSNDHQFIKNEINKITIGGGDDTAEDVAWAFEQANILEWKSNARFAILITDAPCHGLKYHDEGLYDDYPGGIVGRKTIEESIKELIEKNISLFCIQLRKDTEKMYKIIENIYNEKNEKEEAKCSFLKVNMNSPEKLSEEIIKKSLDIYKKQRKNKQIPK